MVVYQLNQYRFKVPKEEEKPLFVSPEEQKEAREKDAKINNAKVIRSYGLRREK